MGRNSRKGAELERDLALRLFMQLLLGGFRKSDGVLRDPDLFHEPAQIGHLDLPRGRTAAACGDFFKVKTERLRRERKWLIRLATGPAQGSQGVLHGL